MYQQEILRICLSILLLLSISDLHAEGKTEENDVVVSTDAIHCQSSGDERQHCDADTSRGAVLQRSVGSAECVLGRNWGYDDQGVWVSGGCSGEFLVAGVPLQEPETVESAEAPAAQSVDEPAQPVIVTCTSAAGDPDRQRCDADTSAGVLLQRDLEVLDGTVRVVAPHFDARPRIPDARRKLRVLLRTKAGQIQGEIVK